MKDKGTAAEFQHETHRAVWTNVSDCTENRQNDHILNCSRPDLQSSTQNKIITPTVRILHQALQMPCERVPKELTVAQKESKPGSAVCGDDSGYCLLLFPWCITLFDVRVVLGGRTMKQSTSDFRSILSRELGSATGGCNGNLPPIDESRSILDSSNGQARCVFGHELPAQISTASFPHPANPTWIMNANVCRSCPVTLSRSNAGMSGCSACAATRFTAPCTFQRGVPR